MRTAPANQDIYDVHHRILIQLAVLLAQFLANPLGGIKNCVAVTPHCQQALGEKTKRVYWLG